MKINFDHFVQRRRWYYTFSGIIFGLGLLAVLYAYFSTGYFLRLSVDFLGGTRFEVQFEDQVTEDQIREVFASFGQSNPLVTAISGQGLQNGWQVRTAFIPAEQSHAIEDALNELSPLVPGASQVTTVSPSVGQEVTRAAFVAVLVSGLMILGYIMFVFRQVPNSFRYGAC